MRSLLDKFGRGGESMPRPRRDLKESLMSAQTVDIVRSMYDNFAKGDIAAVLAVLAPSVERVEGTQTFLPHHGTHRTPEAVADKVFGMVMTNFEEFAVVPEYVHDAGDTVVVEGRAVGI